MILIYLQAMQCNQENLSQKAWYVLILHIAIFFINNSVNIINIIYKLFNGLCFCIALSLKQLRPN